MGCSWASLRSWRGSTGPRYNSIVRRGGQGGAWSDGATKRRRGGKAKGESRIAKNELGSNGPRGQGAEGQNGTRGVRRTVDAKGGAGR